MYGSAVNLIVSGHPWIINKMRVHSMARANLNKSKKSLDRSIKMHT